MVKGSKALVLDMWLNLRFKAIQGLGNSKFLLSDMYREMEFASAWKAYDFSWGKQKYRLRTS